MKHELIERTVREWVLGNPRRGSRELERLAAPAMLHPAQSAEEIAEALIQIAGKLEIAETRVW